MEEQKIICNICGEMVSLNSPICTECGHINLLLCSKPSVQEQNTMQELIIKKSQDRDSLHNNQVFIQEKSLELKDSKELLEQFVQEKERLSYQLLEKTNQKEVNLKKLTEITKQKQHAKEILEELQKSYEIQVDHELEISSKPITLKCDVTSSSSISVEPITFNKASLPSYLSEINLTLACSRKQIHDIVDIQFYVNIQPLTLECMHQQKIVVLETLVPVPEEYKYTEVILLYEHENKFVSIIE